MIDGAPIRILMWQYHVVNSYSFVDTLLINGNALSGTLQTEIGSLPRLSKYLPLWKDMFMPVFRYCCYAPHCLDFLLPSLIISRKIESWFKLDDWRNHFRYWKVKAFG